MFHSILCRESYVFILAAIASHFFVRKILFSRQCLQMRHSIVYASCLYEMTRTSCSNVSDIIIGTISFIGSCSCISSNFRNILKCHFFKQQHLSLLYFQIPKLGCRDHAVCVCVCVCVCIWFLAWDCVCKIFSVRLSMSDPCMIFIIRMCMYDLSRNTVYMIFSVRMCMYDLSRKTVCMIFSERLYVRSLVYEHACMIFSVGLCMYELAS